MRSALMLGPLLASCASTGWDIPSGYEPVYSQDFATQGARDGFHFSDRHAWKWDLDAAALANDPVHGTWLEAARASNYAPPHRSPLTIALIRGVEVGDFVIELEVSNTAPASRGSHRDLCFFFGFQDPAHFYYVHLAPVQLGSGPDDNAHNVFLVDGADRRRVAPAAERGIDWGTGWHRVRLERTLGDGAIRVFFDDMRTPVIEATDATLGWGRVGFGTFDDSGRFTNVILFAPEARTVEHTNPFGGPRPVP